MRLRFSSIAAILVALSSIAASPADPLAEAKAGMVECYTPNYSHKTCSILSGYTFHADGTIDNWANILVSAKPDITIRQVSPVTFNGTSVCGIIRKRDIETAKILVQGQPAPKALARQIKDKLETNLAPALGKQACSFYTSKGYTTDTWTTIGGVGVPSSKSWLVWVHPKDGYKLGR